ncbi:hypothetical protein [Gloeothece verrucosa]|uniref:Uncharacterized protein n=1 Tax=Gloeothece verrucosa (strain PCC 7822) TaxID=497965 RepID=E0UMP1_GLOV7|nr:hypothetical protein [Gloeothece verrucosa]ADN18221.1 hypothetical protein Cyan7822_6437 [Gloeothece verrucosa PCC 7822]
MNKASVSLGPLQLSIKPKFKHQTNRRGRPSNKWFLYFWTTAVSIYLSGLPAHAQTTGGTGGGCLGFLCGPRATLSSTPPFNNYSDMISMVFVGLNILIVSVLGYQAYRIIKARNDGEEYGTLAQGTIMSIIALFGFNYLANWVMGIAS